MTDERTAARAAMAGEAEAAAPVPWPRMVIALLCLIGLLISGYLVLHRLGLVGRLLCGASGSCEVVQSSKYAVLLGIPVAGIGAAGYLVLLVLAMAGLQPGFADRRISWALLALEVPAVAFTVYLNALEAFVIHAWCRWCLGSTAIVALILAFTIVDLARSPRAVPSDREVV